MSRLIDADEVIKFYANFINEHGFDPKDARFSIRDIEMNLWNIPTVEPTVNEWIPVSERLPGIDYINEYILIAVDDDVIPVMVLDGLNWGRGVWGFKDSDDPLEDKITFSFYPWDEISAWQPLPKPYEVEK